MCSTFKWLLAAAVLARADSGALSLSERVSVSGEAPVGYAPVTSKPPASGQFTIEELCAAAVEDSDNLAANLLLRRIDGPVGLTRFLRGFGDATTRLDRNEPTLNTNFTDDVRDTTTPRAMAASMNRVLLGTVLTAASRTRLVDWMKACHTGQQRLRAGLPADWVTGDKTGTGDRGAVNDLAITWPPARAPILIAAYLSGSSLPSERLSAVHVRIAQLVAESFA
jgi:beta-lactamase class A